MNFVARVGSGLSAQDERAISEVIIAYATAIDQRDWHLLHSCFTGDCDADYGSFGKWHGATAITEYMRHAHADLGPTLHRISNIDIRTVERLVQVRSYVDALLTPMKPGGSLHRGVGSYDDHFVRTGDGWKIAKRRFNAIFLE